MPLVMAFVVLPDVYKRQITSSLADAFGVGEAPVVRTALDDDEPRPSSLVKDTLPGEFGSRVVPTQEDIVEAMREVIDPELGVNVVDLGMVADILIDDEANVIIDMVPTLSLIHI